MQYNSHEPFAPDGAARYVWDQFKSALADDDGDVYHRHHVYPPGRTGPDLVVLHRRLGLFVIDCVGCRVDQVVAVDRGVWAMRDFPEEAVEPATAAEDRLFAIKGRFDNRREARGLIAFRWAVAVPFVTSSEWQGRGFESPAGVLFRDELTAGALSASLELLAEAESQTALSDEQWAAARAVLRGSIPRPAPRAIPAGTPQTSPARVIRAIETRLKDYDAEQNQVAFEVPDGPQRIRGLAGTGKTVLFAQRAAKIHARHPDWDVAFVFFTRTLYDEARERVRGAFFEMTECEPNWEKLRVIHAWAFYRELAQAAGRKSHDLESAERLAGTRDPEAMFQAVCGEIDRPDVTIMPRFDAALIDEGQDLPTEFYHIAYKSLRPPHRLYWAYDEAQGIGTLTVPSATEVFAAADGYEVGDLAGKYEGGVSKTHVFRRCYRTPQSILLTATAINMGLFRDGGPLQGITRSRDWEDLGYEVQGDFRRIGSEITVRRKAGEQRHLVDVDADVRKSAGPLIVVRPVENDAAEIAWAAAEVRDDIQKRQLSPEDILITAPASDYEKDYFKNLRRELESLGVQVWTPGEDRRHEFRTPGRVTLCNIFRAKGNEAWKVYVCRFQYAAEPLAWKAGGSELHKRNEAFVALTRTRLWAVVSGKDSPALRELTAAVGQATAAAPQLTFRAFTQSTLKRILSDRPEADDVTERAD